MTGTTCEIERSYPFQVKIPCMTLNNLIMENAEEFKAPQLAGPREKTGSTDFGNVMYDVPGCCIRTAFVPEGTAAHSKEYLEAGKTEKAHEALRYGAEILAGTCVDILERPELLSEIQTEAEGKGRILLKINEKIAEAPLARPLFFVKTVSADNLIRGIIFR